MVSVVFYSPADWGSHNNHIIFLVVIGYGIFISILLGAINIILRFFDILFSCIAIIILFPLVIPVMIVLKLTGEHYIFYTQVRIGKHNRPFKVLKFATMLRDSPNLPGGLITVPDDPRLLPLGKFLRKTKINELPQLLNILIGQMSIVGYRPFVEKHYTLYSDAVKNKIKTIKPGLTGIGSIIFRDEEEILHSVSGRDNFHDKIITPYKGLLECWYVENQSVKNYFLIIFCTFLSVLNIKKSIWKKLFVNLPDMPLELISYLE
jgi:lipopolysaccharide/colanic/teichoic acid biosynthesis glycosyltransferase